MSNEALGVSGVGGLKDACPLDLDAFGVTEMDRRRGMEPKSGVAVLVVVPMEETPAERAAIFDRAKTVRKLCSVLERLELGL